jgi:hypothetical protein
MAIDGQRAKKAPEGIQGLLAGSSWLLHIKQICIKIRERSRNSLNWFDPGDYLPPAEDKVRSLHVAAELLR